METLPCSAGTQKTVCTLYVLRGSATVCFCKAFLKKIRKASDHFKFCLLDNEPKPADRFKKNYKQCQERQKNPATDGMAPTELRCQDYRVRLGSHEETESTENGSFSKKYDNMSKILSCWLTQLKFVCLCIHCWGFHVMQQTCF